MTEAGRRLFRQWLGGGEAVAAPGVYDPLGARIAAHAGHRALYLGGNAMALGLGKGQPFLTATETAAITARIAAAVDLPLFVDMGAGFGEPAHLDVALREIEAAGASAVHIDDQPYPKRAAYHRGRGALMPPEAMVRRLRAARGARRDPDLAIVARTDALRVAGSLDEGIARGRLYREAGADALMVLDLGPGDAAVFRDALPDTPLVWIGGVAPPVPSLDELSQAGFRIACYPFSGIAAATVALADVWEGLARTGRVDQSPELLARARRETLALAEMERAWALEDDDEQA
ncbi:MAG TPA: isocitrate lyase/PEP mutase family protein [Allosphingosinicella sp.]|jgi:methylisocitrate lyase|nr:isocitrate lyase/PEP mutase family protein [Allosphingosinicella sp.]